MRRSDRRAVLGQTAPTPGEWSADINRELEQTNVQTRQLIAGKKAYADSVEHLVGRLSAGEMSLAEAVEHLMKWDKNRNPAWQDVLMSIYPGRSMQQSLARQLLYFVRAAAAAPSTQYRLHQQFEALFGGDTDGRAVEIQSDVI